MNIPKGFRLVPVDLTEEMLAAAFNAPLPLVYIDSLKAQTDLKNRTGYKAMLAAAPATPQPIYDEAKERELFEAYCAKVGLPIDTLPSGEYLIPATRFMSQGWHARAKAGEDE